MEAANPFDQFDGAPTAFGGVSAPSTAAPSTPAAAAPPAIIPNAATSAAGSGNPFDQFDGSPTAFGPAPVMTPAAAGSSAAADTTVQAKPADRAPTLGQVGQQFGYGVLQGIPNAVEGVGNMLEKGTMQGFTNPETGESLFSQLGRDLGINSAPAPTPAPYQPKIGGAINSALSSVGLNPNNLPAPQSGAERVANMAGQGAVLAVAPELGGLGDVGLLSKIGALARPAAVGTISGGAGQVAAEVVPDQYKPLAMAAGALAGGLGAEGAIGGAKMALGATGDYLKPLTSGGQQATAGDILATKAQTTPADLISQIDNSPGELVPGSSPTLFQKTGNMPLGGFERSLSTQNSTLFSEARAAQNSARLDALGNIQAEGHPEAVADQFRQQMADIDQQSQAAFDEATQATTNATDQLGAPMTAEAAGNQARTALQAQLDASKAQESQLWKAVDPDNTMTVVTSPVKRAVQSVYGDISPELATNVTPAETALADVVNSYGPTLPFQRLTDLRSVVSQAMRAAKSPIQPNDMAYGRLSQLRGAIEDAISDSVQGKVAEEQQAVATGAMAPGDTMMARYAQKRDDWLAQRDQAAATGTGDPTGLGADAASGPTSFLGSPGAGSEAGIGSAGSSSPQGLPQDAGSGPLVDQGAADRLAAATAATKSRKEAFGAKPVANILQRPGATHDYKMPAGEVAANLWRPGPVGGTTVKSILTAAKNGPDAIEAVRNTAAASLRSKGALTPDVLAKWKTAHADALNALEKAAPGTMARFENVERATENLGTIARQRKDAIDAIQNSALGRVMKVSDPSDVTKVIGGIFGRSDSVKAMKEIADAARKSPEAFQGLRKAIVDHMQSKLIGNTEAGTSGRDLIKADQFQSFIGKNHVALRQVFSDEEINSMRAIAQDLKRANRSITAVRLPGGSNTAQDLSAVSQHSLAPTLLNKLMTLASEGGASAVGSLFGPLGAVGGYVGAHVLGSMRSAGISRINDLVRDAMLDPDLAKALLMKAPKRLNAGSEITLAHRLANVGLLSGALVATGAKHSNAGSSR